jgi:beta-lactam-binding protein with PASTA domain
MSLRNFIFSKVFARHFGLAAAIIAGGILILLIWLNFYTRHGQARPVPNFYGLTLEETAKLAKKSKVKYQIIDSVYTNAVPRGCIAEQNPYPGFRVKKWRNIVLTINAFHPEMVAMPNLIDLPKRQAILVVEGAGLEMGLLKYKPDLSIDVVIDQHHNGRKIAPGDSIQKGSVIDLILGKGLSNQRTPVPELIGFSLESAKNRILGSSLNLGAFIFDNSVLNGNDSLNAFVYKQNPEFNEESTLQLGSAVYIWLTTDSAKLPVDSTIFNISDTIPLPEAAKPTSGQ